MIRNDRSVHPGIATKHYWTELMIEYLINCGGFNILVIPHRKSYYILDTSAAARRLQSDFLDGREMSFDGLASRWFDYGPGEVWHGMDGAEHGIDKDITEAELIDYFVLKKHNFGSLVAVRDGESGKVKLFKRERLSEIAAETH